MCLARNAPWYSVMAFCAAAWSSASPASPPANARGPALERPHVPPRAARVQREAVALQLDRLLVPQGLAQPVQRDGAGLVRGAPFGVGPQRLGELRLAHLAPAVGDERHEQLD